MTLAGVAALVGAGRWSGLSSRYDAPAADGAAPGPDGAVRDAAGRTSRGADRRSPGGVGRTARGEDGPGPGPARLLRPPRRPDDGHRRRTTDTEEPDATSRRTGHHGGEPMAEHGHGHSPAAWTAVTILLVGAFLISLSVVVQACGWPSSASCWWSWARSPARSSRWPASARPSPPTRAAPPPSAEPSRVRVRRRNGAPDPPDRAGPLGRRRAARGRRPRSPRPPRPRDVGVLRLPQHHRPALSRLRRAAGGQRPGPRPLWAPRWRPTPGSCSPSPGSSSGGGAWVAARLRGAAAPLGEHAVRLSLLWAGGFMAFGVLRLLPPFAGTAARPVAADLARTATPQPGAGAEHLRCADSLGGCPAFSTTSSTESVPTSPSASPTRRWRSSSEPAPSGATRPMTPWPPCATATASR